MDSSFWATTVPSQVSGGERRSKAAATAELPAEAVPVFEALRAWRGAQAKELGLPAYVIFHDATLREIAALRPGSLAELGGVSGLGEKKLATYGEGVLEVLAGLGDTAPPAAAPETSSPDTSQSPAPVRASEPAPVARPAAGVPDPDPEFGWDEEPPEFD